MDEMTGIYRFFILVELVVFVISYKGHTLPPGAVISDVANAINFEDRIATMLHP